MASFAASRLAPPPAHPPHAGRGPRARNRSRGRDLSARLLGWAPRGSNARLRL